MIFITSIFYYTPSKNSKWYVVKVYFQILYNDTTNMEIYAIVNAVTPKLLVDVGVCGVIFSKANWYKIYI